MSDVSDEIYAQACALNKRAKEQLKEDGMKQKGKICGLSLSKNGGLESFSVRIDFRVGEEHLRKNKKLKNGTIWR